MRRRVNFAICVMDGYWMVIERPIYTYQYAATIYKDYGAAVQHTLRTANLCEWLVQVTNRLAVLQFLFELARNARLDGFSIAACDMLKVREN